ncbi:hypothetical protein BCV70DRAFT_4330 [Testicularia cyperi]|uniref:sn-1-specific diacylglycerol lipase n=1 Tax=Testicularia cyperi TaxID=1882483 RepID=A0A317XWP1_9BASI|nr:hypothetical protein BCV70DRAFT_4330 [Testicularia cyperi]
MAWEKGTLLADDGGFSSADELGLDGIPSSISAIDPFLRNEAAQPVVWADDLSDADAPSGTNTPGTATPSLSHSSNPTPSISYYGTKPSQVAITSGVRAWTKTQAYGASDALIKYATASPLLPQQIAEMVSNLSTVARVSLKAAAFFIEIILEAAKHGTGMGLGITRRALISAVGTARAVHSLTSGEEWDAKAAGRSNALSVSVRGANDAFLSILDKYTAVGIYLIHHTFTLAELFAMSSLNLAGGAITAGLVAADESVRTIDGIFGSNETSRALASFITLVRGEINNDPRYAQTSTVSILSQLTKAVTAFAVLQNSTYKRSAKSMKLKVIYDCTVLGEVEAKSWRSLIVGSGNFVRNGQPAMLPSSEPDFEALSLQSPRSRMHSFGSPSKSAVHLPSSGSTLLPNSKSRAHLGDGLCLTDIDPSMSYRASARSGWSTPGPSAYGSDPAMPDDASLMADLNFLVGADNDDLDEELDGRLSRDLPADQLPNALRQQLEGFSEQELHDGVVVQAGSQEQPHVVRRTVRTVPGRGNREVVYEITTEVTETIETVTTMEEQRRSKGKRKPARQLIQAPSNALALDLPSRARSTGKDVIHRDVTKARSGTETHSVFAGGHETRLEEDEEWCEIRTTRSRPDELEGGDESLASSNSEASLQQADTDVNNPLPEAPNGGAAVKTRGSMLSRRTGDDTSSNAKRVPVVLRTMTKKLIQKRKTVRRIEIHDDENESMPIEDLIDQEHRSSSKCSTGLFTAPTSPDPSLASSIQPLSPLSPRTIGQSLMPGWTGRNTAPPHSKSSEAGKSLHKMLRKAKDTLKTSSQPQVEARSSKTHPNATRAPTPLPLISVNSPAKLSSGKGNDSEPSDAQRPHARLNTSAKRVASPTVPSEPKPPKQGGTQSPGKSSSTRTKADDLPSIPQRGASQRQLNQVELPWTSQSGPSTPHGSTREPTKRRSRAPSMTSIRSFASRSHMHSTATGSAKPSKHGMEASSFPQSHLVENLRRFMRYSSAAYGQNFMRILGIGSLDYFFPDTSKHHANVWAFAHHVGISVDNILLNSFSEPQPLRSEKMSPLVNYVAVDDAAKAIVLTCRGTMGLSDILTDLTCDFENIEVEGGKSDRQYQVHSGMLASTRRLCDEKSTVMHTIRTALEDNPDYGLVITGHSLGGGVAALAAVELSCPSDLFRQQVLRQMAERGAAIKHPRIFSPFVTSLDSGLPPGRPIHAFAFGVPAVASPDLSRHCQGLVTSIIHGHDFIPTLSLGMVRDFKTIAHTLSEETDSDIAREIVGRVVGVYRRRKEIRSSAEYQRRIPSHLSALDPPRPQEAPICERELKLSNEELLKGKTRNLAADDNYQDPSLLEDELDPFSYSSGGGHMPKASAESEDPDLSDWLWSLIKTIRAGMGSDKLYPPGDVYCIESFPVFVTSRMQADSDIVHNRQMRPSANDEGEASSSTASENRAAAQRVILRYCEDVEKRFSEPIFAKSMMRDHIPTNYELCMNLLYESIVDDSNAT